MTSDTTSDATPMWGVFLRNCRNPTTGVIADWATAIVRRLDSYTEVNRAGTGIQIFTRAAWDLPRLVRGDMEIRQLTPAECRDVQRVIALHKAREPR